MMSGRPEERRKHADNLSKTIIMVADNGASKYSEMNEEQKKRKEQ